MQVGKAVITAAGRAQRNLPMQTLVDQQGNESSVLSLVVREAVRAGIDDICIVVWPGDEGPYGKTPLGRASPVASRMPTHITLKDVKRRWGKAQEDVYPVAQFEKLWVDMTALPEMACGYVVVPRFRGQQLKEPAQIDGWLRDGSQPLFAACATLDKLPMSRICSSQVRANTASRNSDSVGSCFFFVLQTSRK